MYMGNTISELFKEKNYKILIGKLLLDLDNNDYSLRLTINNKIELNISNYLKKINDLLKNNSIEYNVQDLNELLNKNKEQIRDMTFMKLDERKTNLIAIINNDLDFQLSCIIENIDKETERIKSELELFINNLIYVDILEELSINYKFKTEQQKEKLNEILNKFDNSISSSIYNSIKERSANLKNVMLETINKVKELNALTSSFDDGKNSKTKKKDAS